MRINDYKKSSLKKICTKICRKKRDEKFCLLKPRTTEGPGTTEARTREVLLYATFKFRNFRILTYFDGMLLYTSTVMLCEPSKLLRLND